MLVDNKHLLLFICLLIICYSACQKNRSGGNTKNDKLSYLSHDYALTKPDSTIYYANKVLESTSNPSEKAEAYKYIGLAKKYQSLYDEAISSYEKAINIEIKINDLSGQANTLHQIGSTYKRQKKYDKAVDFYLRSIRIGKTINPPEKELADAYNELGSVFSAKKDFREAKKYFEEALKIRKEKGDSLRLSSSYQDLGSLYLRRRKVDSALLYYDISIELLKNVPNNKQALAKIENNKGIAYMMKGEYQKAKTFFDKSLSVKKTLPDNNGVATTAYNCCNYYYKRKKIQEAVAYCDTSEVYATPLKAFELLQKIENVRYKIAKSQKNTVKALNHHEKYAAWKDSLNIYERDVAIQRTVIVHKIEKMVDEIKQKNRQEKFKYTLIIIFALFALAGLIPYLIATKRLQKTETERRKIAEEKRIQEEKLRKAEEGKHREEEKLYKQVISGLEKEAHVRAVNAEIDAKMEERTSVSSTLHDTVCGDLVAAKLHLDHAKNKTTAEEKKNLERGIELLDEAYKACRKISHDLTPPTLRKFGLASAIEDLCEKYSTPSLQIQFSETLEDERLEQRQELILFQIIQELIQNILKHAEATEANVQLTNYEDALNIVVEDDGRGFDMTQGLEKAGIGLQRIRTRIEHLGGQAVIDSSIGKGTTIIIDVPKIAPTEA